MSRGYTLFEVLVALAIMGFVLASIPLIAGAGRPAPEARAAAMELASALRRTRGDSIAAYRPAVLVLDVDRRAYRVGAGGEERKLPSELGLSLYTAKSELVEEDVGSIRFFPDGGSTGGRIVVTDGVRQYAVAVDWLTGAVSLEN